MLPRAVLLTGCRGGKLASISANRPWRSDVIIRRWRVGRIVVYSWMGCVGIWGGHDVLVIHVGVVFVA